MNLIELYNKKLKLMDLFLQKAINTPNPDAHYTFNALALNFQDQAGLIAHCLALYGNLVVEEMPLESLLASAEDLSCVGENPWYRGLKLIQREFPSSFPPIA